MVFRFATEFSKGSGSKLFHSSPPKSVFVTGAHMDVVGRLDGAAISGVSNPGKIENLPGGISLNMASTAVQLGLHCTIIGPIGDDLAGEAVRKTMLERGVIDELAGQGTTGTYTSILAPDGALVIALADLEIYDQITANSLLKAHGESIVEADILVLNTNVSEGVLAALVAAQRVRQNAYIAAATISPAKAPRLRAILASIDLLFTNQQEAMSLLGETGDKDSDWLGGKLQAAGVKSGTISNGSKPLYWWREEDSGVLTPAPLANIASVTGAGDALGGAILAGLAREMPFETAVKCGMEAAKLTLQDTMPVCLGLNWQKLGGEILAG